MSVDEQSKTILVAASGSGGHLMPARFICEALLTEGYQVEFAGSGRPLEQEIFQNLPIPLHEIPLTGLSNLGVLGALKFFMKLPSALIRTNSLLTTIRPAAVVGVGGYASVLPVLLAWFRGIPTWVHEAELTPGNANRFLGKFATKISLAFGETDGFPAEKCVFTGHPLRPDVAKLAGTKPEGDFPRRVLVLGGSQGAQALDDAFYELADELRRKNLSLFHQCRPENVDRLKERYREVGIDAEVSSFVHELGKAYENSDLIVCRAGAGTVMEIGVVNRPTIFVPFPFAQGLHQHKNAETLIDKGKAVMVEEGAKFSDRLFEQIRYFLKPDHFKALRDTPTVSRPLDAAERIARGVKGLIEH